MILMCQKTKRDLKHTYLCPVPQSLINYVSSHYTCVEMLVHMSYTILGILSLKTLHYGNSYDKICKKK